MQKVKNAFSKAYIDRLWASMQNGNRTNVKCKKKKIAGDESETP